MAANGQVRTGFLIMPGVFMLSVYVLASLLLLFVMLLEGRRAAVPDGVHEEVAGGVLCFG